MVGDDLFYDLVSEAVRGIILFGRAEVGVVFQHRFANRVFEDDHSACVFDREKDLYPFFFKLRDRFDGVIEDVSEQAGEIAVLNVRKICDQTRDYYLRVGKSAELGVDYIVDRLVFRADNSAHRLDLGDELCEIFAAFVGFSRLELGVYNREMMLHIVLNSADILPDCSCFLVARAVEGGLFFEEFELVFLLLQSLYLREHKVQNNVYQKERNDQHGDLRAESACVIRCGDHHCRAESEHRNRRNREGKHRIQSANFAIHIYKGKDQAKKREKDYLMEDNVNVPDCRIIAHKVGFKILRYH